MKKLILTLTASLACVAAFAQGKISFQTDNNHLVYYDPSTSGAGTNAGHIASTGNQPIALSVDLYMGTASGALSLYASTSLNAASNPGKWGTVSVQADGTKVYGNPVAGPAIPGNTSAFVLVQVRDSSVAAANSLDPSQVGQAYAQAHGYSYYGYSSEFTFTLGTSSITYPVMYGSPTWAAGTFDTSADIAGSHGAIAIFQVPEPSTAALAGLAIAGMTIFRRRK